METLILLGLALTTSFVGWAVVFLKKRRAESWPMTSRQFAHGRILSKEFRYVAEIPYSYSANGSYYAGFYRRTFAWRRYGEDFIERVKGQSVFVRYSPGDAGNSVIREQDNIALFFLN